MKLSKEPHLVDRTCRRTLTAYWLEDRHGISIRVLTKDGKAYDIGIGRKKLADWVKRSGK